MPLQIKQSLLEPNKWSRSKLHLGKLRGLVLHWVAMPGAQAAEVRNYFNHLTGRYASAHFVIDLDGKILQILPLYEVAYHAGPTGDTTPEGRKYLGDWPNGHTLGIEFTHPDWSGKYTPETWAAGVKLCALLCRQYGLTETDLYTHHFVTKKDCPHYFVTHPDALVQFEDDVSGALLQA